MERPQLGQWCLISAIAIKSKMRTKVSKRTRYTESQWENYDLPTVTPAVFIGYRTVSDCSFSASDYGEEYEERIDNHNHREVWLFVHDARRKIIRSFPDSVQLIESEA